MSVLNKTPFIQKLLASLSGDEKSALLNCVNGNTTVAKYSLNLRNLSVSTPIESICLETNTHVYNGYKIYKNNKITFLMYNIGQDINMYQVSYPYYEKELKGRVKEPLTIDELRRYLETDEGVGESVSIDEIDSGDAAAGKVIKADGEGGAVWSDDNGLPPSTEANQVLVSDDEGGWNEEKSVPLADNLLASPETNDAPYSSGPTGGLADIATGEEAYLNEIKGMSVVWNQLSDGVNNVVLTNDNIYVALSTSNSTLTFYQNTNTQLLGSQYKVFNLTLMFGSNDKIPFSLENETEYPTNGTIPSQIVTPAQKFARLFANVDLLNAPYDAGTIKNVKVTKLVETGQNLWDASTMQSTGLKLLSGYRYEIYMTGNNATILRSINNGDSWGGASLTRYQRADGKYVWIFDNSTNNRGNCLIKAASSSYPIQYVGFVHSGNYCLTAGTNTGASYANTNATIPAYVKHEFEISGIDGLNGLIDGEGDIIVYDTKDYRRIGVVDLSQATMTWDEDESAWLLPLPDAEVTNDYISGGLYLSETGWLVYDAGDETPVMAFYAKLDGSDPSLAQPTGLFLYPLETPVATGQSAFEPIPLKVDDNWIVNDMGSEYFIQPANTNCPVNQVSYYYQNLKDKLVNLKEIEVESTSFSLNNPSLTGLKINDNKYKLPPYRANNSTSIALGTDFRIPGDGGSNGSYNTCINGGLNATGVNNTVIIGIGDNKNSGNNCVYIGYNAKPGNYNTNNVAIGSQAGCSGNWGTSIGSSAQNDAENGIAIGAASVNVIAKGVSFDSNSSGRIRTLHMYSPEKIFFRNDISDPTKITFASYTQGHHLSEYIQLNDLAGTWNGTGFTSTNTFTGSEINGLEIVVSLKDTTNNAGLRFSGIVEKYDSTNDVEVDTIITCGSATSTAILYIDDSGYVNISLGQIEDIGNYNIKEVKYHLL